jgi:lactaldehyde dehydrogenase/glycolaldehyde dehydrogenase
MNAYKMLIGGEWISGAETMPVENPANEEVFAEVPVASPAEIEQALEAAERAQRDWARQRADERGGILRRWADLIDKNKDHLAQIITREEGKTLTESFGEIELGNGWLRYYAEFDRRMKGIMLPADKPDEQLWIVRAPVGVVVGIIPWNYPMALTLRKAAPALIAGNSIIIKPHEDTPLSALEVARLGADAGVPPGVLNILTGPGETVGQALVESPVPQLVTFTGSVETGKLIARLAADTVKLVSLELGGKAPFIVMDDCDLDSAVETAVFSRYLNCGQVCICNERTYVHTKIAGEFMGKFEARVKSLKVGDPFDSATDIGPKVNRSELDKTENAVERARKQGARILVGGRRLTEGSYSKGLWYEPTILTDVRQDMDIMQAETFGPVVPIMEFDSFDDVVSLANDSHYGLAAYLFTNDVHRVMQAVRDLDCGELYINRGPGESVHGYHTGWKQSGIGGDDGELGLEHYLRYKTVYLKHRH